jgi:hypothetical protein
MTNKTRVDNLFRNGTRCLKWSKIELIFTILQLGSLAVELQHVLLALLQGGRRLRPESARVLEARAQHQLVVRRRNLNNIDDVITKKNILSILMEKVTVHINVSMFIS